jgi:hypothetical protein
MRWAVMNTDEFTFATNPNNGETMIWLDENEAKHFAREQHVMSGEQFTVLRVFDMPKAQTK